MPSQPDNDDCRLILDIARKTVARAGAPFDVADEIAQKVAYNLHDKWSTPHVRRARSRGSPSWEGYIRRAAMNAYLDHLRSEKRRRLRELRAKTGDITPPPATRPGVQRRRSSEPSSLDQYIARESIIDLINEHLRGRPREVALLIFVDGLSVDEVAKKLELQPRSVREHRKKAVDTLRTIINPSADPGGAT